jgi:dienelactone hydrolase/predicted Ser/Thr protein kinase
MIGSLIKDRYRIDAKLGEGGMGIVYRAHDTTLDRPVAIKALAPDLLSANALKRLQREAQSAARLSHPGVVAIYDVLDDGDRQHIVMEFVEGKTLRDLIPMPWRDAAGLMAQVFEAMDFAHSREIIHRDLKPENIIVTADGKAKVMDFGLARSEGRSRLTQTGMVVGTALYMAPEQALQGKADARSDLYALGCVFYELITGHPPFSGEDPLSVITQHLNLAPRTPRHHVPELPPALEALILRLLAKDPNERPSSAADVARMLSMLQAPRMAIDTELAAGPSLGERLRRTRLVGRRDPLRRLIERLDGLMAGAGGVVLVSGEPGIGKTRLLDETVAIARMRGLQVLTGRCHETDTAIPYLPIADALEAYARGCAPETWQRLIQTAGPELHAVLSDSVLKHNPFGSAVVRPETSTLLTVQADMRPTRALRNLLNEVAKEAPVLVVIDDLHWADPPSLELIHHLALHTREMPVLILGAYREIELDRGHPLSRLLVDLNRERLLGRERVRRLSVAETGEFLTHLLGGAPPDGFAELIHEQTEGNPFFIEELVNGLVEDERLVWSGHSGCHQLAPGVTIEGLAGEVPQGIRAAIGARLDRLDPTAQQVLGFASVIGRYFSLDVLIRLARGHGLTEEDVERAVRRARAAQFIFAEDAPADRRDDVVGFTAGAAEIEADHAFDHPLIQQAVYSELDRRRRRRLHAEVGYLFEAIHAGRVGLYAERIAYHFLESDDDAKALEYSTRAGDKILRTYYDSDLALGYYLAALEMVVGKEPSLRHLRTKSPVPIRRGALHRFTPEERDAVVAYLGDVLQVARETPVAKAIAQLASRICVVSMHTGEVYEASVRLYEQCLLGPDVKKLVVETTRGKLVGILEFPGSGGSNPVVLMFHGSGGTKEVLADPAQVFLARGLATLRVDLPGFGETTVPVTGSPADAEILKEMVTAVLAQDRVDSRGVGVIGWSLGPWHAAHLCARDDRVRAMVGISGNYNPLEGLPGIAVPEALTRAFLMARWKAGARPSPDPITWSPDAPVYTVASQIRCPMLLVYGALEPELFRVTAEKLAALVPTATKQVWRTGVHALRNIPEALENAADWMKQQLFAGGDQ